MRQTRHPELWVFIGFLVFALLQFLFLSSLLWPVVPWLEQPVIILQIVMIGLDCVIALKTAFYLVHFLQPTSPTYILPLLIAIATVGGGTFACLIKPFILLLLVITDCGYYWEHVDFPQYHTTIYFKPESCGDGVNLDGYEVYASEDWHPLMQPLLTSKRGELESSNFVVSEDTITFSAWQEGDDRDSNEDNYQLTVQYNLRTGGIKKTVEP